MALVTTTLDLYRAGIKSGARFEHFPAANPGILTQNQSGVDWVLGPNRGGASTLTAPIGYRGIWYCLPRGTTFDDAVLRVWNDYPGHWIWEPARDMPLSAYLDVLRGLNAEFIRV
jgi:hypothetical protein